MLIAARHITPNSVYQRSYNANSLALPSLLMLEAARKRCCYLLLAIHERGCYALALLLVAIRGCQCYPSPWPPPLSSLVAVGLRGVDTAGALLAVTLRREAVQSRSVAIAGACSALRSL